MELFHRRDFCSRSAVMAGVTATAGFEKGIERYRPTPPGSLSINAGDR
jgi:hypothetical protein